MKIVVWVSAVVLFFVLASVGGWAIVGPKASGAGKATKVRLQEVQRGALVEVVSAPGLVEPRTKVEISAKVSARIVELPYREGDEVHEGDSSTDPQTPPSLLIRLDSSDLEADLRSVKARRAAQRAQIDVERSQIERQLADLQAIEAALKEATSDLKRHQEMARSRDISKANLETIQMKFDEQKARSDGAEASIEAARGALRVSRFNVEAADAEIERAEDSLSYTRIYSPIDGVVTTVNAEVGEMVVTGTMNNPGTVIMEVADLSQMLVTAELDEADIGLIQSGQKARVSLLAYPNQMFDGKVESIALTATEGTSKHFKTEIVLDTKGKRIYSGLTADAEIEIAKHENEILVPSQAVLGRPYDDIPVDIRDANPHIEDSRAIVTVVYKFVDGKAIVTPVQIGPSDATHTIIRAGLGEGDQVIAGPYNVLEGLSHDQVVQDERKQKEPDDVDESDPEG